MCSIDVRHLFLILMFLLLLSLNVNEGIIVKYRILCYLNVYYLYYLDFCTT